MQDKKTLFNKLYVTTFFLVSILFTLPATAQEQTNTEEQDSSTTIRQFFGAESNAPKTSASTDTVDAQEAESFGYMSTAESLRYSSGVQAQTSGSLGSQATLRMRGATEDQNLVLLDGVPLNSPFDASFDFGSFLLTGLEEIDLLKGGQAGYYGSGAMGGAALMQSLRATGPLKARTSFEGGSFTTLRALATVQQELEKFGYAINFSRTSMDEDLGNDAYTNYTLSGRVDVKPTDDIEIAFTSRYYDAEKNLPVDATLTSFAPLTIGFVQDENRAIEKDFFFTNAKLKWNVNEWYKTTLQGAYFSDDSSLSNPADTGGSLNPNIEFTDVDFDRYFLRSNHLFTIYPGFEVEAGYEFFNDFLDVLNSTTTAAAKASVIDQSRFVHAGILQTTIDYWKPITVVAGARIDSYSDFGEQISPHIKIEYFYEPHYVNAHIKYSQGFRAPSARELSAPVVGNTNLNPETVHNIEAGLEKRFQEADAKVKIVGFYNLFDALIAVGTGGQFDNTEDAHSRGFETEGCVGYEGKVAGCLGYTFTDTELNDVLATNQEIPLIAKHNIFLSADVKPVEKLHIKVGANYRTDGRVSFTPGFIFQDINGTQLTNDLDTYVKVDLSARYRVYESESVMRKLDLTFHGENLLNAEYDEFPGFPNSGITLLGGVELTFM